MAMTYFNAMYAEHGFEAVVDVSGQRSVRNARSFSDSIIDAALACTIHVSGKDPAKNDVSDACCLGAWDDGPGRGGVLKGRILDQDGTGNSVGRTRMAVCGIELGKKARKFGEEVQIRAGDVLRRGSPRRVPCVRKMVLICAVLLALCQGTLAIPLGYSTVEDVTNDLKRLYAENKEIREANKDLREQLNTMSEKMADVLSSESVKDEEPEYSQHVPFWMRWWTFHYDPAQYRHNETNTTAEGCISVRCCVLFTVDRALDLSWRFATDPIGLFEDISKGLSESFESQLKFFSAILGACLVFFGLNVMVFAMTKFAELCEHVRKMVKALMKLPLISFLFATMQKLFRWVLTTAEVVKPQDLVDKVDRKVDVLTETMQKIVDIIEEPNVPNTSGRKVKIGGEPKRCTYCGAENHQRADCPRVRYDSLKCSYCGRKGHVEEDCRLKKGDERFGFPKRKYDGKRPKASSIVEEKGQEKVVKAISVKCDVCGGCHKRENCLQNKAVKARTGLESIPESVSSIERSQASTSAGKSQASVSVVREGDGGVGEKTLVHAPIHFNGVKFANCLIDTGSQVNLMPASHATRHGFACRRDGIRAIRGFDGSPGRIFGTVEGELSIGRGDSQQDEFLVSPDISRPIVGMPALKKRGLCINCGEHEIFNPMTGDIILCSAVTEEKN